MKKSQLCSVLLGVALTLSGVRGVLAQMVMPGQFDVSPGGAATYTVPIEIPPGIAGVQPQISLSYSSQGGGGLAGLGWNLSGIPSIARCPQTMLQDGARRGISLDTNDRFCMDGQRLVVSSGTYGASGSQYRTEFESFSQITPTFDAAVTGGPAYFTVKTKAGLTMEFGKNADSRLTGRNSAGAKDTVAIVWWLNKITDTKGNYLTVAYGTDEAGNGLYPLSINYTGNQNTIPATNPQSAITLSYETRSDSNTSYVAGRSLSTTKRLSKISTASGSISGMTYSFNYTGSDVYASRLKSIQACSSATCFPALSMIWEEALQSFTDAGPYPYTAGAQGYTWIGDFNGDGLSDVATASGTNVYVHLSQLGGGFAMSNWAVPGMAWGSADYTWTGDFNGDGKTDIASALHGNVRVLLSTGSGFTLQTWTVPNVWGTSNATYIADFDGDGRSDIATWNVDTLHVRKSTGTSFSSESWYVPSHVIYQTPIVGDLNGDGKADLLFPFSINNPSDSCYTSGCFMIYLSTGSSLQFRTGKVGAFTKSVDFNGDGMTDVGNLSSAGKPKISMGGGDGSFGEFTEWNQSTINSSNGFTWLFDVNGDGKTDVVAAAGETLGIFLSTGQAFNNSLQYVQNNWGSASQNYLGDFNGDGKTDIAVLKDGSIYLKLNNNGISAKVVGFNTGLAITGGRNIDISYATLASGGANVYDRNAIINYPLAVVTPATSVVSSVVTYNGVGGVRTKTYKYGPLIAEIGTGRGILGYAWTQVKDMATGLVARTYYRQDFPYTGMVDQSLQGTAEGSWNISRANNSYTCFNPAVGASENCTEGPGKRFFVYPAVQTSKSFDFPNGAALPGSQTCTVMDDYGNAVKVTTDTLAPQGGAAGFRKMSTNIYKDDVSNWFLGRLVKSQVTSSTGSHATTICSEQADLLPVTSRSTAPSFSEDGIRTIMMPSRGLQ